LLNPIAHNNQNNTQKINILHQYPYIYNAKILLQGGRFSTPIAVEGNVDIGNKVLANTGTIKMYGIQRKYLFRL
jgi:hypothetical protein